MTDKYDSSMPMVPWWLRSNASAKLAEEAEDSASQLALNPYCRGKTPKQPPHASSFLEHTRNAKVWQRLSTRRRLQIGFIQNIFLSTCRPVDLFPCQLQATKALIRITRMQQLFWFHCPKCGTSFYNTLYHWMCPVVPHDVALPAFASITYYHKQFPVRMIPRCGIAWSLRCCSNNLPS